MTAPESMREFLRYHQHMAVLMAVVALVVAAALAILFRPGHAWTVGFALGAGTQIFKFAVLDIRPILAVASGAAGPGRSQLRIMFLSLVLFGSMAAAGLWIGANIWAMAAGVFLPRLILLADTWFRPDPFARGRAPVKDDGVEGVSE
ncbi:MAG: hypothetical protein LBE84_11075 [Planctomycetota bacterium]|jgi:hypothetical protein|nr:hypothetical protein [Planctomycetota bacterium]